MLAPARSRITSLSRTCVPFSRYSFCPSRYTMRSTITSEKSMSKSRLLLSKTSFTLARFCRGRLGVPPQIMSSPFLPRIDFIDCSPRTKRKPSATLDLPDPLGPTIEAMGEVKTSCVFLPNDLNPESSMLFKYIGSIVYQNCEIPFHSQRTHHALLLFLTCNFHSKKYQCPYFATAVAK